MVKYFSCAILYILVQSCAILYNLVHFLLISWYKSWRENPRDQTQLKTVPLSPRLMPSRLRKYELIFSWDIEYFHKISHDTKILYWDTSFQAFPFLPWNLQMHLIATILFLLKFHVKLSVYFPLAKWGPCFFRSFNYWAVDCLYSIQT